MLLCCYFSLCFLLLSVIDFAFHSRAHFVSLLRFLNRTCSEIQFFRRSLSIDFFLSVFVWFTVTVSTITNISTYCEPEWRKIGLPFDIVYILFVLVTSFIPFYVRMTFDCLTNKLYKYLHVLRVTPPNPVVGLIFSSITFNRVDHHKKLRVLVVKILWQFSLQSTPTR